MCSIKIIIDLQKKNKERKDVFIQYYFLTSAHENSIASFYSDVPKSHLLCPLLSNGPYLSNFLSVCMRKEVTRLLLHIMSSSSDVTDKETKLISSLYNYLRAFSHLALLLFMTLYYPCGVYKCKFLLTLLNTTLILFDDDYNVYILRVYRKLWQIHHCLFMLNVYFKFVEHKVLWDHVLQHHCRLHVNKEYSQNVISFHLHCPPALHMAKRIRASEQ